MCRAIRPTATAVSVCRLSALTNVSPSIDTRAANSIAYLGASFLRAIEVSDLETRLRALEDRHDTLQQARARVQ